MKKIKSLIIVFALSLGTVAFGADTDVVDPELRSEQIENRVHEIWKMDFDKMENAEKLQLKEELKSIKKELKTEGLDSKVSISVGAIIIILLLLILI